MISVNRVIAYTRFYFNIKTIFRKKKKAKNTAQFLGKKRRKRPPTYWKVLKLGPHSHRKMDSKSLQFALPHLNHCFRGKLFFIFQKITGIQKQ